MHDCADEIRFAGAGWRRLLPAAGFTLLELVVAVSIVGVLAVVAVPLYRSQGDRYRLAHDNPPDSLDQLSTKAPLEPWGRPYEFLSFPTLDNAGKGRMRKDRNLVPINTEYDPYSRGPDGDTKPPLTAQPSRDDIVRANDGGYIGKADAY